ncbi:MAG: 2Fe-2S iron-sulfur cluster-binding protein [Bacteroidota bacterium]
MIKIQVEDTDGSKREISFEANPSSNVMEVLTEEKFDVPAICGGMAGCGTCHIAVLKDADKLDAPDDDEEFMLDSLPNFQDGSRLSCQLPLTDSLSGMEIKVLGDG